MAQHDYIIANQSGAAFRADLNNVLAAIVSNNGGAAQPSPTYAYMWWDDLATGLVKKRNAANNGWYVVGTLGATNLGLLSLAGGTLTGALLVDDSGTAALPAIAFDGDPNTGIFSPGADQLAIATNGVERVEFGNTEVVFNDGGADVDFRVEGDTKANLLLVDAGADTVSIDGTQQLANQTPLRFGDSDNSHYVALRSPATVAANVTWDLPATDGTAGQGLTTNGSGVLSFANPGTILQVINATYSTQASTAQTTFIDTGLTATITPKLATSKILVLVNQSGLQKTASTYIQLRLLRAGSSILDFEKSAGADGTSGTASPASSSCCYLDNPATTSATIYKTQFKSFSDVTGTGAVYVQVSSESSTITLMEVAQ